MSISVPDNCLIACMCEGGAETAIVNILLDHDLLVFNRSRMLEETVLRRVSAREFEKRYLRYEYDQKIMILRIIDSRNEMFRLSKAYQHQVQVINVITAPEIEILMILSQGKYDHFCRSGIQKPSDYCKSILKIKNVKSPEFVTNYFSDPGVLTDSITEYHRLHKQGKNEASLYDLLKLS